jgi:hypothetical protein
MIFAQSCLFCGTLFGSSSQMPLVAGLTVHAAAR